MPILATEFAWEGGSLLIVVLTVLGMFGGIIGGTIHLSVKIGSLLNRIENVTAWQERHEKEDRAVEAELKLALHEHEKEGDKHKAEIFKRLNHAEKKLAVLHNRWSGRGDTDVESRSIEDT